MSPSFRQALLPSIFEKGPGLLADWRFIWGDLAQERAAVITRHGLREDAWRQQAPLRETRRRHQLREWLLRRFANRSAATGEG
jgi:hypothetical protein